MADVTPPFAAPSEARPATQLGRVLARIEGALGSAILVGLDRLTVSRTGADADRPRRPWLFVELAGADLVHYGSLPVVVVRPIDGSEARPVLVLERHQIGAALDGLSTLRRLIPDTRAMTRVPA